MIDLFILCWFCKFNEYQF